MRGRGFVVLLFRPLVCIRSGAWSGLIREGDSGTDRDRLCPPTRRQPALAPGQRGEALWDGAVQRRCSSVQRHKRQQPAASCSAHTRERSREEGTARIVPFAPPTVITSAHFLTGILLNLGKKQKERQFLTKLRTYYPIFELDFVYFFILCLLHVLKIWWQHKNRP